MNYRKHNRAKIFHIDKRYDELYKYRKYQNSITPGNTIVADKIVSAKLKQFDDREDIDHIVKHMV